MIRITAKPEGGFWRCGVHHPTTPVEHAHERFTAAELACLAAEPLLTVVVEEGLGKPSPAKKPKGKRT